MSATGRVLWGQPHGRGIAVGILLVGAIASMARAQEIRIKVLNGRNGRAMANECVNVWVGPVRGPALLIATNGDGIALLRLTANRAEESPGRRTSACGGMAVAEPTVLREDTIEVTSATGLVCQPLPPDSPALTFSVRKVLDSGDASANVCGKVEVSPKPGELIFFERPRTFWERLRE
jgi:hypothetical protein